MTVCGSRLSAESGEDRAVEAGAKVTLKVTVYSRQTEGERAQAEPIRWLSEGDRAGVNGISPHALEAAHNAVPKVTVMTDSGSSSDTLSVTVALL